MLAQSVLQSNKLKRPSKEDYAKDIAMIKDSSSVRNTVLKDNPLKNSSFLKPGNTGVAKVNKDPSKSAVKPSESKQKK